MARARTLTPRVTILFIAAAVMTALAVWTSVALAAGIPGPVTISSTTHPDPAVWYPSANPKFTWTAAQETGGSGTIAGYSYVLDQNPGTVPPVTSGGSSLSFLPQVAYTVGSGPAEDRVADLNGDGKLDIIAENASSNTVSVLLGNGDGTFKPAVNYATDPDPWSMDIGDVNGDGKLDIVTCNEAANTVSVLLGNGDGTFKPAVNYTTGRGPRPSACAWAT